MKERWACRVAPSLGGGFEGTPESVWGTKIYYPATDSEMPCVFFGLYGLPDWYALWRHPGRKAILWAGSDIRHFENGYWLDQDGTLRLSPAPLAAWIQENVESWVENTVEWSALRRLGIDRADICPSFLGNVADWKVCYKWSEKPKVYASVSGDDFKLYGWDTIERIAGELPWMEFHLYGNRIPWKTKHENVIVHGRVPREQMNEEIKHMQIGLRPVAFEGTSEIVVKATLMGQYALGKVRHPFHPSYTNDFDLITKLSTLGNKRKPNLQARQWVIDNMNRFPWNAYVQND